MCAALVVLENVFQIGEVAEPRISTGKKGAAYESC
jgi:hypothetical protein